MPENDRIFHLETSALENPEQEGLFRKLIDFAKVPEHSPGLMRAMSQGSAFCIGEYFFIHDDDWLMSIAILARRLFS